MMSNLQKIINRSYDTEFSSRLFNKITLMENFRAEAQNNSQPFLNLNYSSEYEWISILPLGIRSKESKYWVTAYFRFVSGVWKKLNILSLLVSFLYFSICFHIFLERFRFSEKNFKYSVCWSVSIFSTCFHILLVCFLLFK